MVEDMLPRLDDVRLFCLSLFFKGNERGKRELRLLVHQSHAGALIGRGGSKIKELREKSGSNIKVGPLPYFVHFLTTKTFPFADLSKSGSPIN